jgi:diacylglycerol kinase family enzyme
MTPVVHIVVTPGSGEGRALATARKVEAALLARGRRVKILVFRDLTRVRRWAQTCSPTFSHLVCVGGDATLSAAAGAAVRLGIPFVPVPNGFGNIFARAFGHEDRADAVVALLERGDVRWVDVGATKDEIFLSHQSYGFLEQIQQTVERGRAQPKSRLRRHLAYYAMAKRILMDTPLAGIRVEVDGKRVADDAVVVTVANVETYRGFLSLTPTASPLDGMLDVFVLPRTNKLRLAARLLQLVLHAPGRWKDMVLARGHRVVVTVRGRPRAELRTLRRALPLLVPAGSVEMLEERQQENAVAVEGAVERV